MKYQWEPTAEEEKLIREGMLRGWPESDIRLALYRARVVGLNPLAKQIYFDRRKMRNGSYNLVVTLSIDAYRLQADRTEKYAGQEGPYWCGKDGNWHDVWIPPSENEPLPYASKVGVRRKDFSAVLWAVCRFTAYAPMVPDERNKTGPWTLNTFWKKYPDGQIAKCTEAAALRRAFPMELGNVFIPEEMENGEDGRGTVRPNESPENTDPNQPGMTTRPPAADEQEPGVTTERKSERGKGQRSTSGNENQSRRQTANDTKRQARIQTLAEELELTADDLAAIERQNGGDVLAVLEQRVRELRQQHNDSETTTSGAESKTPSETKTPEPAKKEELAAKDKPGTTSEPPKDKPQEATGGSRGARSAGARSTRPGQELAKRITEGMNRLKLNSDDRRRLRQEHPNQEKLLVVLTGMYREQNPKRQQAGGRA